MKPILPIKIGEIIKDGKEEFVVENRGKKTIFLISDKPLRHYREGEIKILREIPFHVTHSADHRLYLSLTGTKIELGN